jgi:methanogenic corrinoid protein MtbC1
MLAPRRRLCRNKPRRSNRARRRREDPGDRLNETRSQWISAGRHESSPSVMKNTPNFERVIEQLFSHLVSGERRAARNLVDTVYEAGIAPETVAKDVFWPVLEMVTSLYRKDQITQLSHQYATRILRMLVDQGQARYTQRDERNQRVCMFCGPSESEELAGQLVADLLEADGYEITFAGGGVANDEIREELSQRDPNVLLLFASSAKDAPFIRELIDGIRENGAYGQMQIVVGGGIFNRAPGLAEEIGADVCAASPSDLLEKLVSERKVRNDRFSAVAARHRRVA